jgi:hypothetical protein
MLVFSPDWKRGNVLFDRLERISRHGNFKKVEYDMIYDSVRDE